MPPIENDNERSDPRMRRLAPSEIRFRGTVRQFRLLLQLQVLALEGRIGGPNDGKALQPDQ